MSVSRFGLVDSLRGIAAIMVLLFHAFEGRHLDAALAVVPGWVGTMMQHGDLGVAIFFVLSGFVIAQTLSREDATIASSSTFLVRRFIRLTPPYWVAIGVAVAFSLLADLMSPERVFHFPTVGQILSNASYMQGLLGIPDLNPVFWTLCFEVQFYFVLCLAFLASGFRVGNETSQRVAIVFGLVFLAGLAFGTGLLPAFERPWFINLFHMFLLGAGAYWSWQYPPYRIPFAIFVAVLGVASVWHSSLPDQAAVATAVILCAAALLGKLNLTGGSKLLQWTGTLSYSIYLLHNPITGAAFRVGNMAFGQGALSEFLAFVFVLVVNFVAAAMFWWLIEKPCTQLSKSVLRKSSVLKAAA